MTSKWSKMKILGYSLPPPWILLRKNHMSYKCYGEYCQLFSKKECDESNRSDMMINFLEIISQVVYFRENLAICLYYLLNI